MSTKTVKGTSGEYDHPQQRVAARVEFMVAIQRTAPQVVSSLAHDVLPHFKKLLRAHTFSMPKLGGGCTNFDEVEAEMVPPILRWAANHHLAGPNGDRDAARLIEEFRPLYVPRSRASPLMLLVNWVYWVVMDTLETWAKDGGQPGRYWNLSNVLGRACVEYGSLSVQVHWDVFRERERRFRARAVASFREALDEYVTRIDRLAQAIPSKKSPAPEWLAFLSTLSEAARRTMSGTEEPRLMKLPYRFSPHHYDWLVQYQILGMSRNKIAVNLGKDRSVVGDGVNRAAKMLFGPTFETWLRRPQPGRPRKARSQ